ncbi:MAG: phosphate-starvation-inducible PsiE family protein [Nitrospirota bacterium]|nr:phosphate-starvation-inducible PsiE family protein [Nitrospirota bacterium]
MYNDVGQPGKPLFLWMERLDRWGYIFVGLSLLAVGMFLFFHSWVSFVRSVDNDSALSSSLILVNKLLLVVILLELFRTIIRFLETEVLRVEPYLVVGIIACIRRMLTASAELGGLRDVSLEFFDKYLKDMGINAGLVLLLIVGIFILRSRPVPSDEYDFSSVPAEDGKVASNPATLRPTSPCPDGVRRT